MRPELLPESLPNVQEIPPHFSSSLPDFQHFLYQLSTRCTCTQRPLHNLWDAFTEPLRLAVVAMPGAGKQPPEVQAHIKELLDAGFDPTTIHRRLKVGRSSVYRMKRSLQEHGTAYIPQELNKKNGRPKVLTPEQELEVRAWLLIPENRARFLDDLVWMIHERFGVVCSTTTMSKLKRKWVSVIEAEESGRALDEQTRSQLLETHPNMTILQESNDNNRPLDAEDALLSSLSYNHSDGDQRSDGLPGEQTYQRSTTKDTAAAALEMEHQAQAAADAQTSTQLAEPQDRDEPTLDPVIDERLQQRIRTEVAMKANAVIETSSSPPVTETPEG